MKKNQFTLISCITGFRMALLANLFFFFIMPSALKAQWNPNTSQNLMISNYSDDVQLAVPTNDGKTWISFYSLASGVYSMRAQLLDANGYKLLGPDGILVSDYPSGSATYVYNACLDASNNLIIAMQDQRTGTMQTVLYKISQAGTHLWSSSGVVLGNGLAPNPAVLSTGETIVCWDESVSGTLNLQKISAAGTTVWATPVQVKVGTSKTTRGQIVANTGGTFTMVYQKKGVGISTTLYAQRFDNAGVALYTALQISNQTSSGARYYSILADADTTYFGFYVSQGSRFNSFLQRINPNGTIPWGMNGSNFNTSVASTDNYQMTTDINMAPGSNYIWSVANLCNTLQSQYGIYVQKFLKTTGARQFTDLAKVVYPISATRDQHIDRIAIVNDGPMFMAYNDVDYKIYALRLNQNGDFVWPGDRVELSSSTATAGTPKMRYNFTPVGPNRCAGAWTENRASVGYRGFAQGISIGGIISLKVYSQGNIPAVISTNGGTLQAVDTLLPATANQNVNWSIVPGTGLATISTSGLVTAITNGTIWAKAVAVQDPTVADSMLITISNQLITAPTVVTLPATAVTSLTATLNGSVNANYASTNVTFEWGLTTSYGNTVIATPATVTGSTSNPVSAGLTGLIPGSTYHFRTKGINIAGTAYGADLTFTTALAPPTVVTTIASNVGNTSGQLNGTVNANNTSTVVSFEWGTTTAYGNTIAATPGTLTGYVVNPVQASLTGLTWGTTYHYRCKGVNSAGTSYGTDFSFITGCPIPLAPGTISGPATICANSGNVVFSVPPITNATGYTWTLPAGGTITSGAGTNSITASFSPTAVSGNITVTGTNSCSTGPTSTLALTVNPLPVPTITGTNNLCANSGYITYTTETGMSGYTWTISAGGTISFGQGTNSAQVIWNTPGAQSISVNYSNTNGCMGLTPASYNVTVNGAPGAAGTITGASTVCGGAQNVAYSCSPITNTAYYVWTLPAGATIASGNGTTNITVNFTANASSGNIAVYGNNLCGNGTVSPNFPVTVNALPAAAGTITGDANVCTGSSGHVYSVQAITGATSYTWVTTAGATVTAGQGSNSVTVSFSTSAVSGNITVTGTNSCGTGPISPNYAVTVNPVPQAPVVTVNGNVLASSAATGNQWYYEGNTIPGATGQTYTVINNTGYYWCVATINGCSSPISNKEWVVITGQAELQNSSINIFPVPNDGKFTVSITSRVAEPYTIVIYNQLGSRIYEQGNILVKNGTIEKVIDLRPVASGVYTVILQNADHRVVRKILVNR